MEQSPPILETPPVSPNRSMSLVGRLLNVFVTPGEVYEQIKGAAVSTANWLAPGLILIAISWIGVTLIFSQDSVQQQVREMPGQALDKQVQKGKLSQEQAEQARPMVEKVTNIMVKVGSYGTPIFLGLVVPFWGGLLLWLIGAKFLHADFSYMKAVEVAGLAGMIGVLDAVIRPLLVMITGNLFSTPSLAFFVKDFDPQNMTHGLLAVVNIMTFWVLAVRSLGLARLASVSFAKAATWVFGFWIIQTGLLTGLSFLAQKVSGR